MPATRAPFIGGSAAVKLPTAPSAPSPGAGTARPHLYALPTPLSAPSASAPSADEAAIARPRAGESRHHASSRRDAHESGEGRLQLLEDRLSAAILAASAVLVFLVLALVGLILGHAMAPATVTVAVQPGDSLYSIAQSIDGAPSLDCALSDIRSLNALGSENLRAGQTILVPRY